MRIIKVCGVCGKEFVASKMTSKYCSRRCERVAFRKRESEKKKNEKESAEALREEEKIKSLREKAFLTPKDVGVLFGVSRATVYRYFQTGIVKAIKIRNKTFVRTSDLDKMFDEASPYKKRKYQIKEEQEYYTLREIMEKYHIGRKAVWGRCDFKDALLQKLNLHEDQDLAPVKIIREEPSEGYKDFNDELLDKKQFSMTDVVETAFEENGVDLTIERQEENEETKHHGFKR